MRKYEKIIEKAAKNGGMYETKKYTYKVIKGLHVVLLRAEKGTKVYRPVYTILWKKGGLKNAFWSLV